MKRQKNDTADAEAITEAAVHPYMWLVEIKSQSQQAVAMVLRTRDLLVWQRTQLVMPYEAISPNTALLPDRV